MLTAFLAFFKAIPELLKTGRWAYTEIKQAREEAQAAKERQRADDEVDSHF